MTKAKFRAQVMLPMELGKAMKAEAQRQGMSVSRYMCNLMIALSHDTPESRRILESVTPQKWLNLNDSGKAA